jgi:hypothetical protein
MFNLNSMGSRILELLESGSAEPDIVNVISHEFSADREVVANDVREFIEALTKHKLVTTWRSSNRLRHVVPKGRSQPLAHSLDWAASSPRNTPCSRVSITRGQCLLAIFQDALIQALAALPNVGVIDLGVGEQSTISTFNTSSRTLTSITFPLQ